MSKQMPPDPRPRGKYMPASEDIFLRIIVGVFALVFASMIIMSIIGLVLLILAQTMATIFVIIGIFLFGVAAYFIGGVICEYFDTKGW